MARRVNYGYEKFQKEVKRKKKQAEKLEKKRLAKEANKDNTVPANGQAPVAVDTELPASDPAPTTTD